MKNPLNLLAALLFALVAFLSARASLTVSSVDFLAFYCGGAVLASGADPYRVEPLRTCEHNSGNVHAPPMRSGTASPIPLPGYDLAPLALFSHLPYRTAGVLWQVMLWGSLALSIAALRSLTGLPFGIVTLALIFSDGFASAFTGNLATLSIAAICAAAWCASRGRHTLAAICAACALCEPHLGLGAVVALAIFSPAARLGVAGSLAVLGALTYLGSGVNETLEYLRDVLPRHALSEVANEGQYSLTYLLHISGVGDHAAVLAGNLSYLAMLATGVVVAGRARNALRNDALLLTIPSAFTLIGGPFIHLSQMGAAMPAALQLYALLPAMRAELGWSILTLAIPWTDFVELLTVIPCVAVGFGMLAGNVLQRTRLAAIATLVTIGVLVAAANVFQFTVPHVHVAPPSDAFAQDAWRPVVDAVFTQNVSLFLALKLPTWCGLGLLAYSAVRCGTAK